MASLNESMTPRENMMVYRNILINLPPLNSELFDNDKRIEETKKALDTAKEITESSTNISAGERHIDSCVLRKVGEQVLQCAQDLVINSNVYSWRELAEHVSDHPQFWEFGLPRQVRSGAFLLGAGAAAPSGSTPAAPRRRAAQRQRAAVAQRPQHVDRMELPKEDSQLVKSIHKFIRRRSRGAALSYLHAVLDPASFCRTVENIYYVSFLAREGKIAVHIDEERGIPMLQAVDEQQVEMRNSDANQFVISIDMVCWERLIQATGIKEAMMKFHQDENGKVTLLTTE